MNQNRRQFKNFVINKEFQFKVIFYNFIYLFSASVITAIIILFPEIIKMNSSAVSDIEKYHAATNFIKISARTIPAIFALFTISFVHMLILTHRICGPIISFNKSIDEFKKGNIKARINLRKKDFLTQESENVNEVLENFSNYIESLKDDIENLEKKAEGCDGLKNEIIKLKRKINSIET